MASVIFVNFTDAKPGDGFAGWGAKGGPSWRRARLNGGRSAPSASPRRTISTAGARRRARWRLVGAAPDEMVWEVAGEPPICSARPPRRRRRRAGLFSVLARLRRAGAGGRLPSRSRALRLALRHAGPAARAAGRARRQGRSARPPARGDGARGAPRHPQDARLPALPRGRDRARGRASSPGSSPSIISSAPRPASSCGRFASMRWSILTPELSLHWDGETLS